MKRWIQYLDVVNKELQPICGTFDIVQVDGRLTERNQLEIAHKGLELKYNGKTYRKGFLLLEGERLLKTRLIKYYKTIENEQYKLGEYCFD